MAAARPANPVILIIEDEPAIADTIRVALAQESFQARIAATGMAGLEALQSQTPSLVVLDVGLPDQSGFDVLRKIRASSSVPVILLTARAEEIDRVLGLELGADDYMVKPFSPRELGARVRAILRRARPDETLPSEDLSAKAVRSGGVPKAKHGQGPFRVDAEKRLIYFFDRRLILTPYEYGTLRLLVERPGWIFSREKIMDLVWDEPEDSFDRAVDTVIKQLRSRLRDVRPDLDPIETRRGEGYCLREDL